MSLLFFDDDSVLVVLELVDLSDLDSDLLFFLLVSASAAFL